MSPANHVAVTACQPNWKSAQEYVVESAEISSRMPMPWEAIMPKMNPPMLAKPVPVATTLWGSSSRTKSKP